MTRRREAIAVVRRVRARLEAVRLLKAASRGALWAGGAAFALAVLDRLVTAWSLGMALPFAIFLAGAVGAAIAAALRHRITLPDAALFLDQHEGTKERFVTVLGLAEGPFLERTLAALPAHPRAPRLPFPREAAYLPAAAFLLFAIGLVPERAPPAAPVLRAAAPAADGAVAGTSAEEPLADPAAALEKLAQGDSLAPEERALLEQIIERTVQRPEDRSRAREALEKTKGGEGAAQAEAAKVLQSMLGGRGGQEDPLPPEPPAPGAAAGGNGMVTVTPYPEQRDFLIAYRRYLAEEREK